MATKTAQACYDEAVRMLATIHEFADDAEVIGDRFQAIHNLVLGPLAAAIQCDPDFVPALEMRVRVLADELGSYAEAPEYATALVQRDPKNAGYLALRARLLQLAQECYPDVYFEQPVALFWT